MKRFTYVGAVLAALLSVGLVAGPLTPVNAARAGSVAAAEPYGPKIPTECRVKLAGKGEIAEHRYKAGARLKARFAVKENSPREMRTPVKFRLVKGGDVVDTDRFRYTGDPQRYRIAKVRKGKYTLHARTKDGENSRFKNCSAKIRFRAVAR